MTLLNMNQNRIRFPVRDYVKGQGISLSHDTPKINGEQQRTGLVLSRDACDDEGVQVRDYGDYGGDIGGRDAGDRWSAGVAPCFEDQNPESLISANEVSGAGKFLIHHGHKVSVDQDGHLTINGNKVYMPDRRIDGEIQRIEEIDLEFTTDKTPLDYETYKNTPYNPQPNPSSKIAVDGCEGYATKVTGTKSANEDSIYNDGTPVIDGNTEHYTLGPVRAEWQGSAIQVTEVVTACQLEPQDKYKERNFKYNQELPIEELQVGQFMENQLFPEMVLSAELAPVIEGKMSYEQWQQQAKNSTVDGLFGQLLDGQIDGNGLRAGLIAIIETAENREGATVEDIEAIKGEITQASVNYEQAKAEREKMEQQAQALAQAQARKRLSGVVSSAKDLVGNLELGGENE